MDYGRMSSEGIQFILQEAYHLNSEFYAGKEGRNMYPKEQFLFTAGLFPNSSGFRMPWRLPSVSRC